MASVLRLCTRWADFGACDRCCGDDHEDASTQHFAGIGLPQRHRAQLHLRRVTPEARERPRRDGNLVHFQSAIAN